MICQRCGLKQSTGQLVYLFDECFLQWEAEVQANPDGIDLSPVDLSCIFQKAGGLVPDDAKGITIHEQRGVAHVRIVH